MWATRAPSTSYDDCTLHAHIPEDTPAICEALSVARTSVGPGTGAPMQNNWPWEVPHDPYDQYLARYNNDKPSPKITLDSLYKPFPNGLFIIVIPDIIAESTKSGTPVSDPGCPHNAEPSVWPFGYVSSLTSTFSFGACSPKASPSWFQKWTSLSMQHVSTPGSKSLVEYN